MTFKVGDVVRLKSGSPDMTVSSSQDNQILCSYYSNDNKCFKKMKFTSTELLIRVSSSEPEQLIPKKQEQIGIVDDPLKCHISARYGLTLKAIFDTYRGYKALNKEEKYNILAWGSFQINYIDSAFWIYENKYSEGRFSSKDIELKQLCDELANFVCSGGVIDAHSEWYPQNLEKHVKSRLDWYAQLEEDRSKASLNFLNNAFEVKEVT